MLALCTKWRSLVCQPSLVRSKRCAPAFGKRRELFLFSQRQSSLASLQLTLDSAEDVGNLELLVQRGAFVDENTLYSVLKRCIAHRDLAIGSRIHALAVKCGFESNSFLANHIICMYASHGRLVEAKQVFDHVPWPNRYMWASIILSHARHGKPKEAIKLYGQMLDSHVKPNNHVFVAALKACATAEDLCAGRKVHSDILGTGCKPDMFVYNGLVDMYSKCGSLEDARKLFDDLPTKDVVTWNSMITGYAQHGLVAEALTLYRKLFEEGLIAANRVTFVAALQACAKAGALSEGKEIHAHLQMQGLESDLIIGNSLVNMYAKCGSLEDACRVFNNLRTKDVVAWNAMIAGYAQHGLAQEAFALFGIMQQECRTPADIITFVCLLHVCGNEEWLDKGKEIHAETLKLELAGTSLTNALVNMYTKCGSLENAREVFDRAPRRDVVTWTAMIAGYSKHEFSEEALSLYARMREEGIILADAVTFVCLLQACSNVAGLEKGKEIHSHIAEIGLETDLFVANALVDMYGKCGSMSAAQQVFDAMAAKDIVTWSALIAGYTRLGNANSVIDLFQMMKQEGMQPNGITFLSVLTVCSHVGRVTMGQMYFEAMSKDYGIAPTTEHYVCMVDLLSRANQIDRAIQLVKTMPFHAPEIWRPVLGACQKWSKVEFGIQAFESAVKADRGDAAVYVLMSNIYSAASMPEKAKEIHAMRVEAGAWKKPGKSWWTDNAGVAHRFEVGDKEHARSQEVHAILEELYVKLNEECDLSMFTHFRKCTLDYHYPAQSNLLPLHTLAVCKHFKTSCFGMTVSGIGFLAC